MQNIILYSITKKLYIRYPNPYNTYIIVAVT